MIDISNQDPNKIFFGSDLHLGHNNIIKFCNRPFYTLDRMNRTLITNWNKIIKKNYTVFFLGDLCFGGSIRWLRQLNGKIIFIKGNHDKKTLSKTRSVVLKYNELYFLLIHDPYKVKNWNGWVIHGHVHNNEPFIKRDKKEINVSVDVTNFRPVSLQSILQKILVDSNNMIQYTI